MLFCHSIKNWSLNNCCIDSPFMHWSNFFSYRFCLDINFGHFSKMDHLHCCLLDLPPSLLIRLIYIPYVASERLTCRLANQSMHVCCAQSVMLGHFLCSSNDSLVGYFFYGFKYDHYKRYQHSRYLLFRRSLHKIDQIGGIMNKVVI